MEKTDSGINIFINTPLKKEGERNYHLESQLFEMKQKSQSDYENTINKILSFIESQHQKDIERDAWCENIERQCKQKDEQLENMKLQLEDCKAQIKSLTEKVAQLSNFIEQTKGKQNGENESTNYLHKFSSEETESTDQNRKFSNEENESTNQLRKFSSEENKSSNQHFSFPNEENEAEERGIISTFGDSVSITAGGYNNRDHPISFLRVNDKNCFANFHVISQIEESECFILFDFGSSKIDLKSYLIRSNGEAPSSYAHPKTWRVEGSNNKSEWKLLDRRINDQSLNGKFYQNKFMCQYNSHGEKDGYRYIRYSQEENWLNDDRFNYRICLSRFELYGDVFNNE